VSAPLPILRLFGRRSLFYCHFPDKLLCVERKSVIKKIYRAILDFIEEICLSFANLILVNSNFTKEIYYKSFKLLKKFGKNPHVLYPAINLEKFNQKISEEAEKKFKVELSIPFFLSINRYERKKNISLALNAFSEFLKITK